MKLKKIVSFLCVLVMILTFCVTTTSADETQSTKININGDYDSFFNDIVFMKNGKTYLPLRLVFPNSNDRDNKRGLKLTWEDSDIRLIYGETDGGPIIELENGKHKFPFVGERKALDIFLEGDLTSDEGVVASIQRIIYTGDEEHREYKEVFDYEMVDAVYLKTVEGGDRIFVSIDDIVQISKLLEIESTYEVQLH